MRPIISKRYAVRGLTVCLLTAGLVGSAGCRKDKPEREYKTITGTALSIDEATGKVAMRFYSKKKQMEIDVVGTVTPETEILINGRVAQLSEIKIGEEIVVSGYQVRDGQRKRMVATLIKIERDEWRRGPPSTTQATTKRATQPASRPARQ